MEETLSICSNIECDGQKRKNGQDFGWMVTGKLLQMFLRRSASKNEAEGRESRYSEFEKKQRNDLFSTCQMGTGKNLNGKLLQMTL